MEKYNVLARKTQDKSVIITDIKSQLSCGTAEALLLFKKIEDVITTGDVYSLNNLGLHCVIFKHYKAIRIVEESEITYPKYPSEQEISEARAWYDNLNSFEKKYISILYSPPIG